MLSEALAETLIEPERVAPALGELMATVGGVTSELLTVTETAEEVVAFPAASRATAVKECAPLLAVKVFQETEKGAVVSSAPKFTPSKRN